MKRILFWLLWGCTLTGLQAQQDEERNEKIEAAKIGMITNRLNLTVEQASQFWPLYTEYNNKKKELSQQLNSMMSEAKWAQMSRDEKTKSVQEILNIRQKEVDVEKDFSQKFMKVISAQQLAELYRTERIFLKRLFKMLQRNRPEKPKN
jgi:hypothetical protein